jgi:hypothetical protein
MPSARPGVTAALDRLLAALADPARRERAVAVLLAGYCGVWTLYGAIAKGSQDVHFDMGEMVAWARETGLGTPKHPPFGAWLVRAWFGVFPLADWAYYLFAMVLATLALWVAWRISAHYLDGDKRAVGLALLTLVPFYNFHALKFNANAVMLPLWAVTTALFLRAFETRRPGAAALAGLAAAAAMLGKYWSIVLLLGLGLAALADRRRAAYFSSSAPWVTMAAGLAALAPHLAWLYANDFMPFAYAMETHPGTVFESIRSGFEYVEGAAAYAALPVLLAALAAWPTLGPGALRDTVWPATPERRLVLLAFALPFALPLLLAVAAHEMVTSLWAIGGMTLLPVVLLSSPLIAIAAPAARRILGLALAFPLIALAASPLIAFVIHRQGVPNHAAHYRQLAQAVETAWGAATDRPLKVIGSYNNLLYGVFFYLPRDVAPLEIVSPRVTPWIGDADVDRVGIALVCPVDDNNCLQALDRRTRGHPAWRGEVAISHRYLGDADPPERFVIAIVLPRE